MTSDGSKRKKWPTLLALLALAVPAGCGQTVEGTATAVLTQVDPAALELGPYPGEPTAYEPEIEFVEDVFAIESRRMLGYLVPPFAFDPDLTHLVDLELVSAGDDSLYGDGYQAVYPAEFKAVMKRHHLIAGVMTVRSNDDVRTLELADHALLRFPSDESARAAAADIDAVMDQLEPALRRIAVPGHAGIEFSTADDRKGYLVVARGPFLVLTMLTMLTMPDPDAGVLVAEAAALLDLQCERLVSATATPVDEILDLPVDPDGIMRRALPRMRGEYLSGDEFTGAMSPAAQVHLELDGAAVSEAFESTGVDLVARQHGTVYRTRDEQAAFRLHTVLAQPARDDEEIASPPGLDDARCRVLDEPEPVNGFRAVCVLLYGRYVAVVGSSESASRGADPGLYQRAAAQYSILVRSR